MQTVPRMANLFEEFLLKIGLSYEMFYAILALIVVFNLFYVTLDICS